MNEKQKRFCEEYIIDHNATQAAIRAGYSEKTAKQIGSRLLTYVDVQEHIREASAKITKQSIASAEEVLEFMSRVMRGEETEEIVRFSSDGTSVSVESAPKMADRLRASESLAKHYALLVDKVEVTKPKTELAAQIEEVLHG